LQPAQQLRQKYCCWTISFHPYMGPMSDVTMLWRRGWFWTCHIFLASHKMNNWGLREDAVSTNNWWYK
jgi:hypothetical protein